ncbi:hypothetical protein [Nocardia xishanensis]|uniref:Secreted protein n=1 Tax=Nocardia xishanensis TaxID=238964 RepID=A0ABW7WXA9_9NOCA
MTRRVKFRLRATTPRAAGLPLTANPAAWARIATPRRSIQNVENYRDKHHPVKTVAITQLNLIQFNPGHRMGCGPIARRNMY